MAAEDQEKKGMPGIIIFVIVICSIFGCIIITVATVYFIKFMKGRKRTLIRMNNEIQFKRGDTFQKHPLRSDGLRSSEEDKSNDNEQLPAANGAKLSNFLVSQENLQRMNNQLNKNGGMRGPSSSVVPLTMEDIRAGRQGSRPTDQVNQQNSHQNMVENFSKDNYEYI